MTTSSNPRSRIEDVLIDSQRWNDEEPLRAPDEEGPAGRAWLLRPTDEGPEQEATVSSWLLNRPGAHPWWEWWIVTVVCLRDVQGLAPAARIYPEAAYEFQILTIDPDHFPAPDPDFVDDGYTYLHPPDVIEQFHGIDDAQAEQLCLSAIREILEGGISPDETFRDQWNKLLRAKVSALRTGRLSLN
jgi:hypothetical protein